MINKFAAFTRLLSMAVLLLFAVTASAQASLRGKLSISTRIFMKERDAKVDFSAIAANMRKPKTVGMDSVYVAPRTIALPTLIDGKYYISAFVRVADDSVIPQLKDKGVRVHNKFQNGLLTADIPIDSIESVAGIAKVKNVDVAKLMQAKTNKARQLTNVDDVLTYSTSARQAGLPNAYDGKGVVVGVIDEGIDFHHKAFQDANGNSRIKRVFAKTSSDGEGKVYTNPSTFPATDNSGEDHGTHTSSTAGGSSVILSGSSTTVTNDHSNASYGGMAPNSDLYLVGTNDLSSTMIADGFANIIHYADSVGEPVVVSNSYGSPIGTRDGNDSFKDVIDQYFGPSHPNHIALFAASNDGGDNMYFKGTSTQSNPLGSVVTPLSNSGSYLYVGPFADVWTRNAYNGDIECKIMIIQNGGWFSSSSILKTVTVTPSEEGTYVSGLSDYISDSLFVFKNGLNEDPNRTEVLLYAAGTLSNGSYSGYVQSKSSSYRIAFQVYPKGNNASCDFYVYTIPGYHSFTTSPRISGYTWTAGSDASSISPEATLKNVTSIGAYVSNRVNGYSMNSLGDIASFSSYQAEGEGITGEKLPWITAPGQMVASAVNSNSSDYISGNSRSLRVNSDTSNPYGYMQGTSMATPVAAGIVALWLQAANENGKKLTNDDVKTIMKETAITDSYTTSGSNASHFGNGKIDALAGIKYILTNTFTTTPTLAASPTELTFNAIENATATQSFTVTGTDLTGNVTATLSDANGVYSLSQTSVTATDAAAGKAITVTFSPKAAGTFTGTVTLASEGAQSVTVSLNGTATEVVYPVRYKTSVNDDWHYLVPDDNGAYDITDGTYYAFEVSQDVENATVNYTRNFTSGTWAAWSFPVDLTVDDDLLNNYQFGYLEGVSNEGSNIDKNNLEGVNIGVKMLKAGKTVKANLPYVVLPHASGSKTFTFSNVTLKKTDAQSTSIKGNSYIYTSTGIYTHKDYANDIWYALTTSGQLRKAGSGAYLNPFRFYLSISDNAGNPYDAKSAYINLDIQDETTGIKGVDNVNADNDKIYDLQGRRVYKPTQKGVYIVNGRKVVIGK